VIRRQSSNDIRLGAVAKTQPRAERTRKDGIDRRIRSKAVSAELKEAFAIER